MPTTYYRYGRLSRRNTQQTMVRRGAKTMLGISLLSRPYPHSNAFSTLPLAASDVITQEARNDVFTKLIQSATGILTSSDLSENEIEHSYGSASQGQWICSKSAGEMQRDVLEKICVKQVRDRWRLGLFYT